jgi:MFS transporter, putative metabolite:H+ symporter
MSVPRPAVLAVTVAALGYLVDIYDLILFTVVRTPSMAAIGVPEAARLAVGNSLSSWQMGGMLVGGILWGILGDKRGRLSVLFASILLYSLANIANGFVTDVTTYKALRFIAGIGLAGELGAGVTLALELLPAERRGWGTTIIAGIGICGAVLAVAVGRNFDWRVAYWIGGAMGMLLLAMRVGVAESGMFKKVQEAAGSRGNFFALFTDGKRVRRYLAVITVGLPVWYAIGILVAMSPEIAPTLGIDPVPDRAIAVLLAYVGLAVGDFASGALSQVLRSRKRALLVFLVLNVVGVALYFSVARTATLTYAVIFLLGIANGYWAVFVTVAGEQFGTNLRATAATTAPNFVRGSLVLTTFVFEATRETLGIWQAAASIGAVIVVLSFVALLGLEETYGKDLDFVEK